MYLPASFWKALAIVTSYLSLSPTPLHLDDGQQPIAVQPAAACKSVAIPRIPAGKDVSRPLLQSDDNPRMTPPRLPKPMPNYPVFRPPGTVDPKFLCKYPNKVGYEACSTAGDRSCWIRNKDTGERFDAATDYEKRKGRLESGRVRKYHFTLTNSNHNADGLISHNMILIDGQYPGPPIEACWGDTIEVTFTNNLDYNGTAVHFHGIRQEDSFPMDGVPGITQCPIAPGDKFTYKFDARQYGTSWYHSHYGVQYANGLLGPLTIHGPATADFDTAIEPILVNDWFHESAYQVIYNVGPDDEAFPSILINGKGDIRRFNCTRGVKYPPLDATPFLPPGIMFKPDRGRSKKYLIRIINTSFSTTFTFSIDNHWLSIVSADFVPILPNYRSHITVGIGQRYNVIVDARPVPYDSDGHVSPNGNYWIRISVAECFLLSVLPPESYNTMGILRYEGAPKELPQSLPWPDLTNSCDDATGLVPKVPWTVGEASNGWPYGQGFEAGFKPDKYYNPKFPVASWSLEKAPLHGIRSFKPLQVNYQEPLFTRMEQELPWESDLNVIPEEYGAEKWIFLALVQPGGGVPTVRHPIHLHGHDFAIVQTAPEKPFTAENVEIQKYNPMRRDVILLPRTGFIVIAFKADNPGSWILHCHIAFHASEGFAMQILEGRDAIIKKWYKEDGSDLRKAERVCKKWKTWHADCKNHWPGAVLIDKRSKADPDGPKCYPACEGKEGACPRCYETRHHKCPGTPVFMDDSGI